MLASGGQKKIFADLIHVPAELEVAVEAALNERLQSVPVPLADIAQTLDLLTDKQVRANLLLSQGSDLPVSPGNGVALLSLVDVDAGCEQLAAQLLAGIYLVEDLSAHLDARLPAGVLLVDRQGGCLDWHGVLAAGSTTTADTGLLKRQRQLEELEQELEQLGGEQRQLLRDLEALREEVLTQEETRTVAVSEGHRLELQLLEITKDRQGGQAEDEHLGKRLALIVFDLEQIDETTRELRQELTQLLEQIEETGTTQQQLEAHNSRLREELADLHEDLELFREDLVQQRMQLATLQQQQKAQTDTMQRIEVQLEDLEQRREHLQQRQIEGANELQQLNDGDRRLKLELDLLLERRTTQQQDADRQRDRHEEQRLQLDEFREQSRRVRQEAEELRKQVTALQLRQRELQGEVEHIRQAILERYRVDLAEHQVPEATTDEVERQQQTLKKLQPADRVVGGC